MPPPTGGETILQPQPNIPDSRARQSWSLPPDLLSQAASRLRVLALLYAFVFFMAEFFPALIFPSNLAHMFSSFSMWGPAVLSIAMALTVAAVVRSPRVPVSAVLTIGLIFEVAGSYGIAAAEYLNPMSLDMMGRYHGLSWVAVWTLFFMVVAPTRPRRALFAALASVSAVPVVIALAYLTYPQLTRPNDAQFFFWLIFPYLLVVVMAYIGARVVYALGAEVVRARELGSYRLQERLGQGGMGEVWSAKHRLLARPAAIKLINRSLTASAGLAAVEKIQARFSREAQAMACLRSPHTVNLYDFGQAGDGAFYYVMELLDGLDAEALVRRFGPVPASRAIHIISQVCHSLSEAHARGLVHRDIKPANIFLCRYGEEFDFVKVLDFGLVKAFTDDDMDTKTMITQRHAVQGTPAFIAPEQALGRPDLDGRVDIYATGCLMYWLLTGHHVFTAETTMQLLIHHAQSVPVAPSSRGELPIPPALDHVVLQCLAKDPAERPQSARDLARLLGEITLPDAWTDTEARDWWTRNMPPHVRRDSVN